MVKARAVRIREAGGPEVLYVGEVEVPDPGPGEVLVEVEAAGLNRADVLQRKGFYPAPPGAPPDVPGLEYAGVVAAVGRQVTAFRPGDRVMGIAGGGGMATHLVAHAREVIPVPDGLSTAEAAAVPEVFLTAFDALFLQAGLTLGETVLLHAVGSGVGTAALQLAAVAGARAIGTSRTADKLDKCKTLGLPAAVLVEGGRFADAVLEQTGGRGADVILDTIGASYLEEDMRAVAPRGRVMIVGLLGGANGAMPLGLLLRKRARLIGTVLRSRALEEKAAVAQAFIHEVLPLLADGRVKPIVDAVLPMTEIAEAHRRMESDATVGKLVLSWKA